MSKGSADERVAAVALRTLEAGEAPEGRWLVAFERTGQVAVALEDLGCEVEVWHRVAGRWCGRDGGARPAPPEGTFDGVVLRVPRARESLAYAAERVAVGVAPGGPMLLVGANDEGVKSAARHMLPWWDDVETVDTKFKSRGMLAWRTEVPAHPAFEEDLLPVSLDLPGGRVDLVAAPGVFAGGGLDPASAMLLQALDGAGEVRHALDFACGIGVLSAGVLQRWPEAGVHALDADALAVACIRQGLPQVTAAVGDGWAALGDLPVPDRGYDLIVSNPPLHRTGNALDLSVMDALVKGASGRLAPKGRLVLVTQRQRAISRALEDAVGRPAVLAEDGRFRVWEVRRRG